MSKLLPNLPINDLNSENDYIGIIEKGNLIKSFFLANKSEFSKIKIFSIYGEWGGGKSTLMKYLEKELKGSFNTFFFESWEFESDSNLANSLLELLAKESNSEVDEFFKNGSKLMEGFAKSITFKTPIANFNAKTLIDGVDNQSFLKLKESFKKDFENWENKITKKVKSPDYNIVFIDDLDRCEPENILNLLSAIKLFFTYGKKTIFLCGIDKKAISEAVKTKYGEVVKSNEYLEKIFDISFSMPESYDVSKLINHYFKDELANSEKLSDLINNFFEKLHFTNPRRIKKILNKYLIIKNLKESNYSENLTLPSIINGDEGTLFETYLTLYLLILHEFEPENYKSLFDLIEKRENYSNAIRSSHIEGNDMKSAYTNVNSYLNTSRVNIKLSSFDVSHNDYFKLISSFTPNKVDSISSYSIRDKKYFISSFNLRKKSFEYYFTLFLFENQNQVLKDLKKSEYSLSDYKEMIPNLL